MNINIDEHYHYLNDFFTEEKIDNRKKNLTARALSFINDNKFNDVIGLNDELLNITIIDYFADIYRLKQFHTDIKHINLHKIYAYISYWWIKRKPLQVIKNTKDETYNSINEKFIAHFLFHEMRRTVNKDIYNGFLELDNRKEIEKKYIENLEYFLIYRLKDAVSLELVLETFEFALKVFYREYLNK